ncbi:MAG: acetylornithine/succinylornithine family transaminase [Nanoarchaeota archaeon]|nr:acetylornithine/succinylornithine family transaminase [Nanoarchaeota archaeon]
MQSAISEFIEKTGKEAEFKLFLDLIQNSPKHKFAVIKISGKTLENHMDEIAKDIAYLNKLDIYPIVVHGAGSQLDKLLPESKKIQGIRYTEKQDIKTIEKLCNDITSMLIKKIISYGGKAACANSAITAIQLKKYGYVGKVTDINLEMLDKIKGTPVINSCLCKLNVNADSAAKELVKSLSPKKLIFLTDTGGVLDKKGEIIPFLNLSEKLDDITGGMKLKLDEITSFVKEQPETAVVITSAKELLKELFTIKGSGTFIKYYKLKSKNPDKNKVKEVIEKSFGKKLVTDYFDEPITEIIYEQDYEGLAIIKKINNIPYLDKFVVVPECQGTNLGKSIWNHLTKKYPKLIWRAKKENMRNSFYAKNCDGMLKNSWNIYWKNLNTEEIKKTVPLVDSKKDTMIDNHLMSTYNQEICIVKGLGSYVWDDYGNKYLDLIGGIATCSVGHANPIIVKAITDQSKSIITASNLFKNEPQLKLAKKLSELSGLKYCFFSNSGTEAVETAIKLALKHTNKSKIIAMKNGFHGRTLASLSATYKAKYKKPFTDWLNNVQHVKYGDITELKQAIDKNTAAVILEPIQGEAGIIVPPKDYLSKVQELCKATNTLLIIDEIQTGNGRTGKFFCFQHENIQPDIVTIAKGLANGIPIGATLSDLDFDIGEHGSTFGGNQLSCQVALKTVEIMENNLKEIEKKGEYMQKKLDAYGKGLMLAFKLNKPLTTKDFAKKGLLVNIIDNKIVRLLPPLTISYTEIDTAVKKIGELNA